MKQLTKKKIMAGALALTAVSLLALPALVGAQTTGGTYGQPTLADIGGVTWGNNLTQIITGLLQLVLGFLGVIAVLIILWGGFIWMTAAGEQDKVDKAKKLIYAGIIGLVIIFAAYAIASFVFSALTGITGSSITP